MGSAKYDQKFAFLRVKRTDTVDEGSTQCKDCNENLAAGEGGGTRSANTAGLASF